MISDDLSALSAADQRVVSQQWVQRWDLLTALIARDIKLRYRRSLLGILWTLLNPLAELLVLFFVFEVVLQVKIPHFGVYLFMGLLVYGWFQSSVNYATGAIVGNRELVRRPGVPTAILPVVTVASNLVHFLLSLPILGGLLVIDHVQITSAIVALPFLIVIQFALILGVSYPVSTIHVWFRDTQHVLRIALQLLFYMTPVFYEADQVPTRFQALHLLNPLAHLVTMYRSVLLRGEWPAGASLLYLTLLSSVLLVIGVTAFRWASTRFADEL